MISGALTALLLCLALPPASPCAGTLEEATLAGRVEDASGAPIAGARVVLEGRYPHRFGALTLLDGRFEITAVPHGEYVLRVAANGFDAVSRAVIVAGQGLESESIRLSPARLVSRVTVTAGRLEQQAEETGQVSFVRDRGQILLSPAPTLGSALEYAPGVMNQQSTYSQSSPFLRGLTGYQVLNLLDGIRFSNSTFRGGPNQYLAFIEPSQAERVEAVLGPSSAEYGSDALGGAINVITPEAAFSGSTQPEWHGDSNLFFGDADRSGAGSARLSVSTPRLFALAGGSLRRHNSLRAGAAGDSRNVFRRLFGLEPDQIRTLAGNRLDGTAFSQHGFESKIAALVTPSQQFSFWYQRSTMDGSQGYKDLLGGLGRLQSLFTPQQLDFFYARYNNVRVPWFDSLSGTFSLNAQKDGSVRQGLNLTDPITTDRGRVNAFGYAAQADKRVARRHLLQVGGELYDERITSARLESDPRTNMAVPRRPLYPDGSSYRTFGIFAQDHVDLIPNRLRAAGAGRLTAIRYNNPADPAFGTPASAQSFSDFTYNASLAWQLHPVFALHVLAGRGFRAPNLNDLGAIGLNDLGYEIPLRDALAAGARAGASSGEAATLSSRPVGNLRSETLQNLEMGITARASRFHVRVQAFRAGLSDPIVRRTLLFPEAAPPTEIAGLKVSPLPPTAAQRAEGVITVSTALDPRAIKAFVNDGESLYQGIESLARVSITSHVSFDGGYSFIAGRDLYPNRAIRRLPPQQGHFTLRYRQHGRWPWLEFSGLFAGAQDRLSGGDLDDERIGASRRRADIAAFFNGARVSPYLSAGPNGSVFAPTGETLPQIMDRVLPIGSVQNGITVQNDSTRVPLYLSTPGYASFSARAGFSITEHTALTAGIANLADRNYRVHGSGVDAPGRNVYVGLRFLF